MGTKLLTIVVFCLGYSYSYNQNTKQTTLIETDSSEVIDNSKKDIVLDPVECIFISDGFVYPKTEKSFHIEANETDHLKTIIVLPAEVTHFHSQDQRNPVQRKEVVELDLNEDIIVMPAVEAIPIQN